MSSQTANGLIALGAFVLFLSFCVLGAGYSKTGDPDEIPAGAGLLAMGSLAVAGGTYLKARAIQSKIGAENPRTVLSNQKVSRGCELCGTEIPVIQCKVHQLHLCASCLNQHYDVRSCVYIPGSRATGKPGKALAKARGV